MEIDIEIEDEESVCLVASYLFVCQIANPSSSSLLEQYCSDSDSVSWFW